MKSSALRYLVATTSLCICCNFGSAIAQTQTDVEIPLDDQAKYLQNLETRSADQWTFPQANPSDRNSYNYNSANSEVYLQEEKIPNWGNKGDERNNSVLIDVYQFTPEEL